MTDLSTDPPARARAVEPPVGPRPNAASNATRLMCVGARRDRAFQGQVIRELHKNSQRVVAPAYGYDTVPVLAHAFAARTLRMTRIVYTVLAGILAVILTAAGAVSTLCAFFLFAWAAWAGCFLELAANTQNVITYLKEPERGHKGFDGSYPDSGNLPRVLLRKIVEEQDAAVGLVHYGGYSPFVGAGLPSRPYWSFAVLLDPPRGALDALSAPADRRPDKQFIPFTVKELTDHVEKMLREQLGAAAGPGRPVERLTVERRRYRKALGVSREKALSLRTGAQADEYDSAREYLCVRVGSWAQELVVSLFVNFDVRGGTLYSELHHYVLPPINAEYHEVDMLPDRLNGPDLIIMAGRSIVSVFGAGLDAVAAVFVVLGKITRRRRPPTRPARDEERRGAIRDFGARTSIRHLAAVRGFHHFFQESDAEKYAKIVERRLLDTVRVYLDEHNVDTAEFRERETSVLNIGIAHTGAGDIVNNGVQSFGPGSKAEAGGERH